MTHMSVQNMNGVGRLMGARISRNPRIGLSNFDDLDQNPTSEDNLGLDPKGLSPNYAPWWVQPPLKKGEVDTQRGTPTPGETRKAYSADRPAFPMTPSNDARDLTNSYTGRPMSRTPRRDYPGSFPHTWIPYEELKVATGPEMGPTPPGWATIPSEAQLRSRSSEAGEAVPWVAEEQMTHDISGFGSLGQVGHMQWLNHILGRRVRTRMVQHLKGMGAIDPETGILTFDTPAATAAANAAAGAVTNQAVQAAASGSSPSVVNQIIDFGSKAAALALQATGNVPKPAAASVLPTSSLSTPVIIGAGAVALIGAIALATRGGKGRRRR